MKIPPASDHHCSDHPESSCEIRLKQVWDEFEARFSTNGDCLTEIVRILLDSGLIFCRECKKQDWETVNERVLKCTSCRTKRSVTAGTFFDHMRSYQAWLAAIWFADRGVMLNSSMFQRMLKISHSSARLILKRVMTAMQAPMEEDQDTLTIPTQALIERFRRRSFETGARQSPREEGQSQAAASNATQVQAQEGSEASLQEQMKQAQAAIPDELPETEKALLKAIIEAPLSSDQLANQTGLPIQEISACLSMLEMDGWCTRQPGNQFRASGQLLIATHQSGISVLSDAAIEAIKSASQFIYERYNGVSRKHLQKYLVAHWCHVAIRKQAPGTVLNACLKLGKKTSKEIFDTVTPSVVRLALAKSAA